MKKKKKKKLLNWAEKFFNDDTKLTLDPTDFIPQKELDIQFGKLDLLQEAKALFPKFFGQSGTGFKIRTFNPFETGCSARLILCDQGWRVLNLNGLEIFDK